jgi:hypothetical protein
MKGYAQALMPDAFEVLRTTYTPDGFGGQHGTTAVTSSGICLLRALSGSEQVTADRLTVIKPAAIDLPLGTDISEKDQIRVNGTRTFEVVAVVLSGAYAVKIVTICNELG